MKICMKMFWKGDGARQVLHPIRHMSNYLYNRLWFKQFATSAEYCFMRNHPIVYFCAEYALDDDIPIYAGGLGILAGDIIREAAEQEIPQVILSTYASTTLGFSIQYPSGYTLNDSYAYQGFPKKPIQGTKFLVPSAMTTGTNLSSDSGISVETLPRAKNCTGDIFLPANVKATRTTENGVEYSVATSSEGAAGNFYEEAVYALTASSPCIAVRYFLHSTNIGTYGTSTSVREFNHSLLMQDFDAIRRSLTFKR